MLRALSFLILISVLFTCPAVSAGQVTLCQCNIYGGGRWTEKDQSATTYDTARRFAEWVAAINPSGSTYPPIAVVGMEELMQEIDRTTIESLLEQKTGVAWNSARTPQGINGASGVGFFWRPDLVESIAYLGSKTVEILDNGYYVNFAGRLFRKVGTEESFGVFTGKLTWGDAVINGHVITEEERRQEAVKLLDWIRNGDPQNTANPGMLNYPGTARVIATDLNTDTGTSTWNQMNTEFADPSSQHTHNSFTYGSDFLLDLLGVRLDYVFWDYDSFGKRTGGFAANPTRSPHVGSDHRSVYATVNVQAVDITPPSVVVTSPANNQTVVASIKVTANATDSSGIGYVEFYVDSVKKWTDSTYPYEYDWDITGCAPGTHMIYASAVDNSSNRMAGKSMINRVNIVVPTYCAGIGAVKAKNDTDIVSVSGRVVSAVFGDCFYIQDPNRAAGIRVTGNPAPAAGDTVDVAGRLATTAGERQINLLSLKNTGHARTPEPLGIKSLDLGGSDFNTRSYGVWGGWGLNNIGLLVKCWGKITGIDAAVMYIDDGAGTLDGFGQAAGVRVDISSLFGLGQLAVGQTVEVTGISSLASAGGKYHRLVRPRSSADVVRVR